MKKIILLTALTLANLNSFGQEVKSVTEIKNEIKTIYLTVDADRFQDLKDFDWKETLTEVFKGVPDDATIGIRINIRAKQLTNDIATLHNVMSVEEVGLAKNKETILRTMVKNVEYFIEDEQQGNNVD